MTMQPTWPGMVLAYRQKKKRIEEDAADYKRASAPTRVDNQKWESCQWRVLPLGMRMTYWMCDSFAPALLVRSAVQS